MGAVIAFLRETRIAGVSLGNMAIAFGVILASVIIRRLVVGVVISSATRLARKTRTELDNLLIEALRKPLEIGIIAIGIGIAITVLGLPREPVDLPRIAGAILTFGVTVLAAWTLFRLIDALSKFLLESARKTESKIDDTLIPLFRKAAKIFVAVMAFVVAVQNLGYSISGLLAGLGIGGLAIALAARDTLANVFGSITILIDKPFKVGDWVSGPGFEGVVEEIGFRSTRIRTFHKTLISIPNNTLVNMTIDNRQAMPMRRMDFVVGVTYDTTVEQMRRALEEIRNILVSHEGVDPESVMVRFLEFGGSSLDIKIKCFTKSTDYNEHVAIREELHLRIMEKLSELGLEIAFPSQTLYFGKDQVLTIEGAPPEPSRMTVGPAHNGHGDRAAPAD